MPCYSPLDVWKASGGGITFKRSDAFIDRPIKVPCGGCIGCRLARAQQWAIRCVHEAQMHEANSFVTLTYSDKNLPAGGTLVKLDFQKFMRRVRKKFKQEISYFHCGEYGPKLSRPHYHALLFGLDFPDKVLHEKLPTGNTYTSKTLETLWGLGFTTLGSVTYESAGYCARYTMKKVTGPLAEHHYKGIDLSTGEIIRMQPEYITMSLKRPIGKKWLSQFESDVFPSDELVWSGKTVQVPRYYNKLFKEKNPEAYAKIKRDRIAAMSTKKQKANNTPERLNVRLEVKKAAISTLLRKL